MMSISGLISAPGFSVAFLILSLLCLAWLLYKGWKSIDEGRLRNGTVVALVLLLLFSYGFVFSATHRVVPINTQYLLVDTTTGKLVGDLRGPGLTQMPMFGIDIKSYPGARNDKACRNFTPSVKEGYEVKVTICYFYDASHVNWRELFMKYNGDGEKVWENWTAMMSSSVADVIKVYTPRQLTSERMAIEELLLSKTQPILGAEGLVVNKLAFSNWDFTNDQVAKTYDNSISSQALEVEANARKAAASVDRETELIKADTAVQVAQKQREALAALGIVSEDGILRWQTLQFLASQKSPMSFVINMGSSSLPLSFPVTSPISDTAHTK